MTTCEDCYHYEACHRKGKEIPSSCCSTFKDKSLILELPCKVGDTVCFPWEYNGLNGVAFFAATQIIVNRDKSYIKTNFTTDDKVFYALYNGGKFEFDDFGKTIFLTIEEAERKLKESRDG